MYYQMIPGVRHRALEAYYDYINRHIVYQSRRRLYKPHNLLSEKGVQHQQGQVKDILQIASFLFLVFSFFTV